MGKGRVGWERVFEGMEGMREVVSDGGEGSGWWEKTSWVGKSGSDEVFETKTSPIRPHLRFGYHVIVMAVSFGFAIFLDIPVN